MAAVAATAVGPVLGPPEVRQVLALVLVAMEVLHPLLDRLVARELQSTLAAAVVALVMAQQQPQAALVAYMAVVVVVAHLQPFPLGDLALPVSSSLPTRQ
jgi:uncharacterized membrane protein (DUF4010 family)